MDKSVAVNARCRGICGVCVGSVRGVAPIAILATTAV